MLSESVGKWQTYMATEITSALCCLNTGNKKKQEVFWDKGKQY